MHSYWLKIVFCTSYNPKEIENIIVSVLIELHIIKNIFIYGFNFFFPGLKFFKGFFYPLSHICYRNLKQRK